jgi:hypothetical protein
MTRFAFFGTAFQEFRGKMPSDLLTLKFGHLINGDPKVKTSALGIEWNLRGAIGRCVTFWDYIVNFGGLVSIRREFWPENVYNHEQQPDLFAFPGCSHIHDLLTSLSLV